MSAGPDSANLKPARRAGSAPAPRSAAQHDRVGEKERERADRRHRGGDDRDRSDFAPTAAWKLPHRKCALLMEIDQQQRRCRDARFVDRADEQDIDQRRARSKPRTSPDSAEITAADDERRSATTAAKAEASGNRTRSPGERDETAGYNDLRHLRYSAGWSFVSAFSGPRPPSRCACRAAGRSPAWCRASKSATEAADDGDAERTPVRSGS